MNVRTPTTVLPFVVSLITVAFAPAWGQSGVQGLLWSETSGWIDTAPPFGGVQLEGSHLSGYAWSERVGWIQLGSDAGGPYANNSSTDWGVNRIGPLLEGYAWSESAGWIRFDPASSPVTIGADGVLDGFAWSESLGWIHVGNLPDYGARVESLPADIPTLGGWGVAVLIALLAAFGARWVRAVGVG